MKKIAMFFLPLLMALAIVNGLGNATTALAAETPTTTVQATTTAATETPIIQGFVLEGVLAPDEPDTVNTTPAIGVMVIQPEMVVVSEDGRITLDIPAFGQQSGWNLRNGPYGQSLLARFNNTCVEIFYANISAMGNSPIVALVGPDNGPVTDEGEWDIPVEVALIAA